ncbi:hypothetical protein DMB44_04430 [Thermoplasma sp. Kam2015]|uniref:hypothetical protein n=1 Tax=Thermoplasma sp. Kam2015 TaxID=2094122 RepID=UPI000D859BAA|nr:hypothetical protein [Thermoplasma sp. Kam2015]PYB68297.1 hypothetical protein DMB44_04430 [Thermoplasma sp. Kam2015]
MKINKGSEMSSPESVTWYFSNKGMQWSRYGSLEQYVKQVGRAAIADELRNDPEFAEVCKYAKQAGELQLRSDITKSVEDLVGAVFGISFVGALDVIIGAIEDACGHKFIAGRLIKSGIVLLGAAALASAFSGNKKK